MAHEVVGKFVKLCFVGAAAPHSHNAREAEAGQRGGTFAQPSLPLRTNYITSVRATRKPLSGYIVNSGIVSHAIFENFFKTLLNRCNSFPISIYDTRIVEAGQQSGDISMPALLPFELVMGKGSTSTERKRRVGKNTGRRDIHGEKEEKGKKGRGGRGDGVDPSHL